MTSATATHAPQAPDTSLDISANTGALDSSMLHEARENLIRAILHINGWDSADLDSADIVQGDWCKADLWRGALSDEAVAIVLCANSANLAQYQRTSSFAQILHKASEICGDSRAKSTPQILAALTSFILATIPPESLKPIKAAMAHILAAGLLDTHRARELFGSIDEFLTAHRTAQRELAARAQKSENPIETKALADEFASICAALIATDPSTKSALESAQEKLRERGFSIGVAGVLSAGKSSFLNALLGKEALGTSTIPETASLTILRYGEQERAVVEFFTPQELGARESSKELSHEQRTLLEKGSIEVPVSELGRYTSANHESRFCDLVKKVELYLPLAFLQGVEIVDTPGIDDPVITREALTKSYMARCDMLIYVMNASCAATQKDMEFILESLLSGHVARLLVVLTRADLLGKAELESSLNYTKESLQQELQKARYEGDIEALLERIDFIPVASLFALGYKLGDENLCAQAREQGVELEDTGLPQVERYLKSMLFGDDSPKQRDMLYSAYRMLSNELESTKAQLQMREQILQASSQDRDALIARLIEEQQGIMEQARQLDTRLGSVSDEFGEYLENLLTLIGAHLHAHTQRLSTQLYDDIVYEYAKGSRPSSERTQGIIAQSLEDSYHDVLREYRYKVAKKLADLSALLESQNTTTHALEIPPIIYSSHADELRALTLALNAKIQELIAKHNKSTQERLQGLLLESLREQMKRFEALLGRENSHIQATLVGAFDRYKSAQRSTLEQKAAQNLAILESAKNPKNEHLDSLPQILAAQKTIHSLHNEVHIILKALR